MRVLCAAFALLRRFSIADCRFRIDDALGNLI
jgi:hypothetical protein